MSKAGCYGWIEVVCVGSAINTLTLSGTFKKDYIELQRLSDIVQERRGFI